MSTYFLLNLKHPENFKVSSVVDGLDRILVVRKMFVAAFQQAKAIVDA